MPDAIVPIMRRRLPRTLPPGQQAGNAETWRQIQAERSAERAEAERREAARRQQEREDEERARRERDNGRGL